VRQIDLVIIGGGSAGMAAAIQAKNDGIDSILIIEKNNFLGGILNQCIHAGFGLTEFKEELTGPEYLSRFVSQIDSLGIEYKLNTQVLNITDSKEITYTNSNEGNVIIKAQALIMATGCYERSAGAISLSGDRCSGIITAGTAQEYLNIHGFLVGKKVVILGSGDIGLIMARRLTLEGAKVICVCEIMPYSNGLNRNIQQCLNDYDIPLYLSTSISRVIGHNGRLEKVVIAKVDENRNFIENTAQEIECDTLLLSIGLIPYIPLLENISCELKNKKTAIVNQNLEINIDGIFLCGNCLHVHDVVDFVTSEGREAGHNAAKYIKGKNKKANILCNVIPGKQIAYVVPNIITSLDSDNVSLKFRSKEPLKNITINVRQNDKIIFSKNMIGIYPSEMQIITLTKEQLCLASNGNLVVEILEK